MHSRIFCIGHKMTKMGSFLVTSLLFFLCLNFVRILGDVGTATSYGPPYLPTRCNGNNQGQFPEDGYFAAVSNGLWDNGAACGRRYRMRCISGPRRPCKTGSIIVQVVDQCRRRPCRSTLALSRKAFSAISRNPNAKINVEYTQV